MIPRILLGGAGPFVTPVFERLLADSRLHVAGVVTAPDARRRRRGTSEPQALALAAEAAGLEVLKPARINSAGARRQLEAVGADLFLTASYGQLLGPKILDLFRHGCWNLHPSSLPLYRGATPVNAALREGRTTTGVTLFRMVREMDAGPIVAQTNDPIHPSDTAGSLLQRLAEVAGQLAADTLPKVTAETVVLTPQDDSQATFCHKLSKTDGVLDWTQAAEAVINQARSVTPWPGAVTQLGELKLTIGDWKCVDISGEPGTLVEVTNDNLTVACGSQGVTISQIQAPGKAMMPVRDFLNGHALTVGTRLGITSDAT